MFYYRNQPSATLFDAETLTADFADNRSTTILTGGFTSMALYMTYDMDAGETGNKMQVKVDASHNGTDWFSLVIDTTSTVSDIVDRVWEMDEDSLNILLDIGYPFMRVSIAESGVDSTFGTGTVHYTLSGL